MARTTSGNISSSEPVAPIISYVSQMPRYYLNELLNILLIMVKCCRPDKDIKKVQMKKGESSMEINTLEPGFYILKCLEEFGYDECFFVWTKGKKYRMEINEFGGCNVNSDTYIFTPMGNRFEEMMECFSIDKDLVNTKGLVEDFLKKRNHPSRNE